MRWSHGATERLIPCRRPEQRAILSVSLGGPTPSELAASGAAESHGQAEIPNGAAACRQTESRIMHERMSIPA